MEGNCNDRAKKEIADVGVFPAVQQQSGKEPHLSVMDTCLQTFLLI